MQKGNGEHTVDLSDSVSRSGSGILLLDKEDAIMSKCCIFRIPAMLNMQNEQGYTPYRFSIGPWHFGETHLTSNAQEFKQAFFKGLIFRFPNPEAKKKELEEAIKEAHSKAKECYEGEDVYQLEDVFEGDQDIQEGVIDAAKEKFEEILLLDRCFIIEMIRKSAGEVPIRENEYVLFSKGMILVIYHDLFLLENQIPWFVLELLFERTRVSQSKTMLVKLAIEFFGSAFSLDQTQLPAGLLSSKSKIVHLIDFARRYLGYSSEEGVDVPQLQCTNTIPSATRLKLLPSATRLKLKQLYQWLKALNHHLPAKQRSRCLNMHWH
ncbi:hypothetical protein SLE2022_266820 [Rubroshorea leprosula]